MGKLIMQTLVTFLIGVIALGALLFLPAGTLNYWQAWVFIIVFMVSVSAIGLYLAIKNPALLERRKKFGPTKEQSPVQKIAISIGVLALLGVFIFSALSHRFLWSPVPTYISMVGDMLVALGLYINILVFKENSYGGASIETVEGQTVISTGLYAFVRHPMYVGVLIMIIGIPLALDAWWGLVIIAVSLPAFIWRILDEEKFLKKDLPGYSEYTQNVRYRLVPYIW
jgi:protein-S-isoprenylcysteine O-methyltransferase Ste14